MRCRVRTRSCVVKNTQLCCPPLHSKCTALPCKNTQMRNLPLHCAALRVQCSCSIRGAYVAAVHCILRTTTAVQPSTAMNCTLTPILRHDRTPIITALSWTIIFLSSTSVYEQSFCFPRASFYLRNQQCCVSSFP